MIRSYLRDLIDGHKPTTELNNYDDDDESGEWKIQLVMQNKCIPTKHFEDTRDVYSASKPVEIVMGADNDDTTDRLFDTLLQRFQKAIETSHANGSGFTHENVALLYYYFMKIDIRRGESKKDNKCFQYSITSGLDYNEIKNKCKRVETDFSSHQRE